MKALRRILFSLHIFVCMEVGAQIVDFSQMYNNYVYLNPAFVGNTSCPHIFTSFRNKYSFSDGFTSAYLSFDMELGKSNSSFGVSFLQDFQSSVFSETELLAIYAKSFQLQKKLFLSTSLAGGYVHKSVSYSNLVFPNMLDVFQENIGDSGEDLSSLKRNDFNSELGLLLYNDVFYAGMTVKNLQGNVTDFNKQQNAFPRILSLHGMAKFSTTKAFMLKYLIWFYPHVNIVIGGTSSYAQMGLILQKWMVQCGGAYRQNFPLNAKTFSFFIGVVEKKFRFAYNCDMTINSSKRIGSHEVSFGYQFDCREKKKKFEAVKAPTF